MMENEEKNKCELNFISHIHIDIQIQNVNLHDRVNILENKCKNTDKGSLKRKIEVKNRIIVT